MIHLDHGTNNGWANVPSKFENRFDCARELAYKTAVSCQLEWSGEAVDFMPDDQDYLSGFYMRNILYYVIQADKQDYGVKTLTEWFKPIDYRVP